MFDATVERDAAAPLDASTGIRCGEATCSTDEVCVVPACGCRNLDPLADGGCPPRFSPSNGSCAPNCPF